MKTYIPSALRDMKPEKVIEGWAIGIPNEHGNAMYHGPFKTKLEALEIIGGSGMRIFHFKPDGSVIRTWKWKNEKWISLINL